jgi:hypothetical protein
LRRTGFGAFAVVLAVLLASCGGGSSAQPAKLPPIHAGRVGPETIFTPAGELVLNPVGTLDELQRLGVDTVHVYLHWADIAPDPTSSTKPVFDATDPAAYPAAGWAPYDTIVRDTKARGMGLILDLVPPPPHWASGEGAPDPATQPQWRPSAPEYGQFVQAVATRYSGHYVPPGGSAPLPRVDFWSIWNEPNLGVELAPQAVPHTKIEVSGKLYRGLLNAAWNALGATGHGHDQIMIGELGPAGATFGNAPGLFAAMAPLRFVRALYCVDSSYQPLRGRAAQQRGCPTTAAGSEAFASENPGLFHATAFADHPYSFGLPPDQGAPNEPDYTDLIEVPKLEHALDTVQHVYGSNTRFPIYSTEYGYQTSPPGPPSGTVSPATAAYYLNWAEYLTWLNPRLRSYDQFLMTDGPGGYFTTGLKFPDGKPKPTYAAFRMPLYLPVHATVKGHPLVVWGDVRPAHNAQLASHRAQHVQIEFQPASRGAFKTVATVPITDRYGYFEVPEKFPGSGNVRLAWSYPHGPQVFSRTVVVTLR